MHDEVERLIGLYDQGGLSRRQLLQGLFALGLGRYAPGPLAAGFGSPTQSPSLFHARTLNHVTLYTSDVARSKAFYQRLTGLPIRAEDKDFCEFRLEGGFLGLYTPDAGDQPGFNHFCFGIDRYDPQAALGTLQAVVPEAKPTLEGKDQVYVLDPDGVRVQLADVRYKQ
jgi:catechol 2,3-dioxygenase-like lactoylglutathione lyase family enzyme